MARPNRKLPELTLQDIKRFWSHVDKSPGQGPKGDCHEWRGSTRRRYGVFNIIRKRENLKHKLVSSRVAYFLINGEDPGDQNVLHTCDNPPCCNGDHFFTGTDADNMADKTAKGRQARGDTHGQHLHPDRTCRGEQQRDAKLSDEAVREIRRIHASGEMGCRRLSQRFGVCKKQIQLIIHRRIWKHVT